MKRTHTDAAATPTPTPTTTTTAAVSTSDRKRKTAYTYEDLRDAPRARVITTRNELVELHSVGPLLFQILNPVSFTTKPFTFVTPLRLTPDVPGSILCEFAGEEAAHLWSSTQPRLLNLPNKVPLMPPVWSFYEVPVALATKSYFKMYCLQLLAAPSSTNIQERVMQLREVSVIEQLKRVGGLGSSISSPAPASLKVTDESALSSHLTCEALKNIAASVRLPSTPFSLKPQSFSYINVPVSEQKGTDADSHETQSLDVDTTEHPLYRCEVCANPSSCFHSDIITQLQVKDTKQNIAVMVMRDSCDPPVVRACFYMNNVIASEASEYFKKVIGGAFLESGRGSLIIGDDASPFLVAAMLYRMNAFNEQKDQKFPITAHCYAPFLQMAHRYGVDALVKILAAEVTVGLNLPNSLPMKGVFVDQPVCVADILRVAVAIGHVQLIMACGQCLRRHPAPPSFEFDGWFLKPELSMVQFIMNATLVKHPKHDPARPANAVLKDSDYVCGTLKDCERRIKLMLRELESRRQSTPAPMQTLTNESSSSSSSSQAVDSNRLANVLAMPASSIV